MPSTDWQPDPTGRHEMRRRNPDGTWSDQVSDSGVLSRDHYDGTQPEPATDQQPDPDPPAEATRTETEFQLIRIANSADQIQRWTGWLVVVVVIYMVVTLIAGLYLGLNESDNTAPFIIEYGLSD